MRPRLELIVPDRLRSWIRTVRARLSGTRPVVRMPQAQDASLPISAHADCSPEFLHEVTTQHTEIPDCRAIATVYRPPSSPQQPADADIDVTTGEATMPRRLMLMLHELHRLGYERL